MTLHELWDDLVPPERRWLGLFIFGSLVAHILFFFVFKIIPPPTQGLTPRPSRVTWLTPTQTGQTAAWLDWRDPSAIALPRSPLPALNPPAPLPDLPDRYADLPQLSRDFQTGLLKDHPAQLPEKAAEISANTAGPSDVKVETPPPPGGTQVEFLGALSGREIIFRKELPAPSVEERLRVTVLSVGVSAEGNVETIMVEETSLDSAIDQRAVAALRQWKFKPKKNSNRSQAMDWGRVVVYWDYQNKPRVPAP